MPEPLEAARDERELIHQVIVTTGKIFDSLPLWDQTPENAMDIELQVATILKSRGCRRCGEHSGCRCARFHHPKEDGGGPNKTAHDPALIDF